MMKAANAQLENASVSCEAWEWGCAGLVVVAVIAEFIIAGVHPAYDSFLEQWGSAAADAAIALGIVGEVLFSRKDSTIQGELRRRSNERAASLEKEAAEARERTAEIEKLTAWRHIYEHQKKIITQMLKDKIPQIVFLLFEDGNSENFGYAKELERYLVLLTRNLQFRHVHLVNEHGEPIFGLRCFSAPDPIYGQLLSTRSKRPQ